MTLMISRGSESWREHFVTSAKNIFRVKVLHERLTVRFCVICENAIC